MSDAGLSFDDDAFEARLVWIFGSTRSGSTWLLRLLCHPLTLQPQDGLGFSLPAEAGVAPPADVLPVDEFLLGHHLAPQVGDPTKAPDGRYVAATVNSFWSPHAHYMLSSHFEDIWRPELRRLVLVRLHAIVDRAARRFPVGDDPAVVIKDVGVSHAANSTMSLLPRSRFLFLVRDGRDVIDSLMHAAQPGSWFARVAKPLITSTDDRLDFLRRKAIDWACWTDSCLAAWDAHAPDLRRMVRYEELLADPVGQLRSLCRWIGVDRDERALEATVGANAFGTNEPTGPTEFARAATPGLWRQNLSSDEQHAANEIMGNALARLGYLV
ncbi:MAG TPA: sulfotransferase [Thermoleophilaceae bacterium]